MVKAKSLVRIQSNRLIHLDPVWCQVAKIGIADDGHDSHNDEENQSF